MKFQQSRVEMIPLAALPYNFRQRLITLAPLKSVKTFEEVYSDVKKIRPVCPEPYNHLYITDNEHIHHWASLPFPFFPLLAALIQYNFLKYVLDGPYGINQTWKTALTVDEITSQQRHIYVEDTLILYCDSVDSYEKVIPFICGPYYRVVLHGMITASQIRRLIHSGVKKVRIHAILITEPEDHHDFAVFVANQVHGLNSCFAFYDRQFSNPQFVAVLEEVCNHHETNGFFDSRDFRNVFVRNKRQYFFFYEIIISLLFVPCFVLVMSYPMFFRSFLMIEMDSVADLFVFLIFLSPSLVYYLGWQIATHCADMPRYWNTVTREAFYSYD